MKVSGAHCSGCPLVGMYEPFSGIGDVRNGAFFFVSDAPGKEARGPLGKNALNLLGGHLKERGFVKEDVYITPLIKCPHDPKEFVLKDRKEITSRCVKYLLEEIVVAKPEVIVPMGAAASSAVEGRAVKITKVRGLPKHSQPFGCAVLPILNPNQVLMYPQHEATFAADMNTLARLVDAGYDVEKAGAGLSGAYEYIDDLEFLIEKDPEIVSFDVETNCLRWYAPGATILTMQFAIEPGKAYTLSWRHPNGPQRSEEDYARLLGQLTRLLCDPKRKVVGHNLKFDCLMLYKLEGVRFKIGGDTILMIARLDENSVSKNLADSVKRFVPDMAGYSDHFDQIVDKSQMARLELDDFFLNYSAGDTDAALRLYYVLDEELKKDPKLYNHYQRVSLRGQNAFVSIESRGMHVDGEEIEVFEQTMKESVEEQYRSLIAQVPKSIKKKHLKNKVDENGIDLGWRFSRRDFLVDILFQHPDGFRLKPKVFTETTANLPDPRMRVPSTSSKDHLPYFFEDCLFTEELATYIKEERLLSTNIVGFKKKYIVDDMVRPQYRLDVTVTGRTACLVANTLVSTLDGRGYVSIRDIKQGDWVWSYDDSLKVVPARVSWSGETKRVTTLVEVVYLTQGRRKRKSILCTADHPFRIRDGSYVNAEDLQPGHRLLSLERDTNHAGYRRVYATGHGAAFLEHRKISEVCKGESGSSYHVHHIDEDKQNNVPTNLEILSPKEHASKHGWTEERVSKMRYTQRRRLDNGEIRVGRDMRGRRNPRWYDIDPKWANTVLEENEGKPSVFRDKYGLDYTQVSRKLKECGVNWQQIKKEKEYKRILSVLPKARLAPSVGKAARILKVNYYKAKELLASDHNHVVVAVRHRRVPSTPVYDIAIEGTHNFIANGVCVHNSQDPNGQNYPKRGKQAKAYRKLFVAPPGYYILEADLSQAELRVAACLSKDPVMLRIYANNEDLHIETALIVSGKTREQFDALPEDEQELLRFKAKAVNFGFIYGMWWKKFIGYAKTQYGVEFSEKEAEKIRERFFHKYLGLERWHERTREFVREYKFVRSYSGCVRHLPMIDSEDKLIRQEAERQAINSPVQEFASSLGVMAVSRLDEEVDSRYLSVIGFVHDAVIAIVPQRYVGWGARVLRRYMESNPLKEWFGLSLPIPIVADVAFGLNLGEMNKMKNLGDGPYNFSRHWDSEKKAGILVPKQAIPPNNGRVLESIYTLPEYEQELEVA